MSGHPCVASRALFPGPSSHPRTYPSSLLPSYPSPTHVCIVNSRRWRLWHNQLQKFDTPWVNGQKARFSRFSYAIFRLTHTYIGTYTHGVNVSQCVCFICISVFDFCRRWRLFNLTCRSVAQQQPPNEINKSAPPFGSNLSLCSRKGLPFARFFAALSPIFHFRVQCHAHRHAAEGLIRETMCIQLYY